MLNADSVAISISCESLKTQTRGFAQTTGRRGMQACTKGCETVLPARIGRTENRHPAVHTTKSASAPCNTKRPSGTGRSCSRLCVRTTCLPAGWWPPNVASCGESRRCSGSGKRRRGQPAEVAGGRAQGTCWWRHGARRTAVDGTRAWRGSSQLLLAVAGQMWQCCSGRKVDGGAVGTVDQAWCMLPVVIDPGQQHSRTTQAQQLRPKAAAKV
jgi:hypothetical protein